VLRTPFMGAIHQMPPHYQAVSFTVGKVLAGMSHSGISGAFKMLTKA
jgi:hypothetical protein